ncbi:hypothetical protein EDD21DRAFT_393695 [Dissophora ornata]|nr:hypothetical protein EDD21DRAFT_393695 [Dissophora ornata]
MSSSPVMALGVLSMVLLALYRLYVRTQRRRRASSSSYTLLPTLSLPNSPSSASFPKGEEMQDVGHSTSRRHSQP